MPKVSQKHYNESFEALLLRFKKVVDRADVIKDIRKKEFFEKPTAERKRKKAAAKKRYQKQLQMDRSQFQPRTKRR